MTEERGEVLVNRLGDPLRVLVVGASSGIGASTATALADSGARVVGAARRETRVAELEGVTAVACDVTLPEDCDSAVATAVEALGGLDALVYAAGATQLTPLDATGLDQWTELFGINLFGAAMVTRAALPHLLAEGSDRRAVYLSSDSLEKPYPGMVAYAASKAGLRAFCQGLTNEFAGLRVTEVMVGPTIDTEAGNRFDPHALGDWFTRWTEEGYIRFDYQLSVEVAAVIVETLGSQDPGTRVTAAKEFS
ncbi:MAG TPA: SDR family oxidoreductase [Acidimicrobiales bacterium]|jgi:NAD(P)-dependent dehydrogenase (short-subunit alcohol dehydrogenase family)|nr:SDR family oxidoreductase [Acidimicrobiales bacterium]